MSFVDRKKQPHLWRDTPATNPVPTAEQVVTGVLSGVAHSYADRAVVKAFAKLKIPLPESLAHLIADTAVKVGEAVVTAAVAPPAKPAKPAPKPRARSRAKKS